MPPLPAAPSVLRFALNHSYGPIPVENILFFKYNGAQGTPADLSTLAVQVGTAWAGNMMNHLTHNLTLDTVTAEDLTSNVSPSAIGVIGSAGGEPNDGLPANCALVISHHISRRYRGGHPRTYVAGLLAGAITDDHHLTPGNVTQFTNDYAGFVAAVVALADAHWTPLAPVNVSYHSAHALRVAPVIDPILTSDCQSRLCSQRRRLGPLTPD